LMAVMSAAHVRHKRECALPRVRFWLC
jgi:hypothetical protein